MPKTLSWVPKTKWARYAIEQERERIRDLGGETPIFTEEALAPKWGAPILAEEPSTPEWEAPLAMPSIEPTEAWRPRARVGPEVPTMPTTAPMPTPKEVAPTPWYRTVAEKVSAPFEWIQEKLEKPWAAAITAPLSPELPWRPGETWLEHQRREYEAWKAPKFLKGAAEFTMPLWWLPYFGWAAKGAGFIPKICGSLQRAF